MSEPEPTETSSSEAYSRFQIFMQVAVVVLLAANVYSIHKFKWTLTHWSTLLILPGIAALLAVAIAAKVALKTRDEQDSSESSSKLYVSLPAGAAVGTLLLVGCLPFWVNTWSASEPVDLDAQFMGTSDAIVTVEDGTSDGRDVNVGTDLHYMYKGHEFSVYQSSDGRNPLLFAKVRRGWLGWEFIVRD